MAEIKHCLAVLVNKERMRNNWRFNEKCVLGALILATAE